MFYDQDVSLDALHSKRIAVIGYGNQGHAHALNLRDSGCEVRVGLRSDGRSWERAVADGFAVQTVDEVSAWADVISVLLPDQQHKPVFETSIRSALVPGKLLMLAHGFSLHFGQIVPPTDVDVAMVAPVGPGHMMRRLYREGFGIPALFAVQQDVSGQTEQLALAYARALGCTRAGALRSTFQEEVETDLFGEQAVLCGGLTTLIKSGFDTLVGAGYQPEVAYFECLHQVKLIVDLLYEGGFASMHSRISDTAEYGDYVSGPRVIDDRVRESMHDVLEDIQDGSFARRWIAEYENGSPFVQEMRRAERQLLIEVVGSQIRSRMPWLVQSPAQAPAESVEPAPAG
jgi:ketol-acid reductoisomerase